MNNPVEKKPETSIVNGQIRLNFSNFSRDEKYATSNICETCPLGDKGYSLGFDELYCNSITSEDQETFVYTATGRGLIDRHLAVMDQILPCLRATQTKPSGQTA